MVKRCFKVPVKNDIKLYKHGSFIWNCIDDDDSIYHIAQDVKSHFKKQNKSKDLMSQLYKKSETKIIKAFKKKQVLTRRDIENEVKNIKASLFYSRDKIVVQNSSSFAKNIINTMISRN